MVQVSKFKGYNIGTEGRKKKDQKFGNNGDCRPSYVLTFLISHKIVIFNLEP